MVVTAIANELSLIQAFSTLKSCHKSVGAATRKTVDSLDIRLFGSWVKSDTPSRFAAFFSHFPWHVPCSKQSMNKKAFLPGAISLLLATVAHADAYYSLPHSGGQISITDSSSLNNHRVEVRLNDGDLPQNFIQIDGHRVYCMGTKLTGNFYEWHDAVVTETASSFTYRFDCSGGQYTSQITWDKHSKKIIAFQSQFYGKVKPVYNDDNDGTIRFIPNLHRQARQSDSVPVAAHPENYVGQELFQKKISKQSVVELKEQANQYLHNVIKECPAKEAKVGAETLASCLVIIFPSMILGGIGAMSHDLFSQMSPNGSGFPNPGNELFRDYCFNFAQELQNNSMGGATPCGQNNGKFSDIERLLNSKTSPKTAVNSSVALKTAAQVAQKTNAGFISSK